MDGHDPQTEPNHGLPIHPHRDLLKEADEEAQGVQSFVGFYS